MATIIDAIDWLANGKAKFGPNRNNWQFVCPICGNRQTSADFLPYRRAGAKSDSVYSQCIGRFNGRKDDPSLPGCLFSVSSQPDAAPVEVKFGEGHSMLAMEFA
jgi:hypothetical protein